ncbi:hypothetical protein T492DRAFT_1088637 [Pavlovales sp. CCMP2436]|nr:hypothetical protein T492DRAFT_1088637 [Pavlovales sp. CCMP2436]|mmetsp:Transcript_40664/g.100487  ORF Transcript_40664/g.100487 Transcript_40664/m.100487 type:complete len:272 (+) Transcript_40664:231-1046(+)
MSMATWSDVQAPSAGDLATQYDRSMGSAFEKFDSGRFIEAVTLFDAASELCLRVPKAERDSSAWVARRVKALNNCAACNDKLGRLDAAKVGYAKARKHLTTAWRDYMFPSLWDTGYTSMLAHVDKKLGMMPRAAGAHVGQGVEVASVLQVGKQMVLESVDLYKAGEFARALPLLEQALAIHEKHAPQDGITLATITNNLASTHAELGHETEARALYLRALQVAEATEEQREHIKKKLSKLGQPQPAAEEAAMLPAQPPAKQPAAERETVPF